ncbi:methyltransferase family protein [Chloroflexota bacterium]
MSLVPAFEIGVWNAWIFMLYEVATIPFFLRMARGRAPGPEGQADTMSKIGKIILYSSKIIMFLAFAYAIFLPLKLGTIWFYVGLPITLVGLVIATKILVDWAKTPRDKPVTGGLYLYSRHPMYIGFLLLFLGVGIATASWVFLVLAVGGSRTHSILGIATGIAGASITRILPARDEYRVAHMIPMLAGGLE